MLWWVRPGQRPRKLAFFGAGLPGGGELDLSRFQLLDREVVRHPGRAPTASQEAGLHVVGIQPDPQTLMTYRHNKERAGSQ